MLPGTMQAGRAPHLAGTPCELRPIRPGGPSLASGTPSPDIRKGYDEVREPLGILEIQASDVKLGRVIGKVGFLLVMVLLGMVSVPVTNPQRVEVGVTS